MRRLSAQDMVRVWEYGYNRTTVERTLALLAPAFPEMTRHSLACLSLGNRDLRLLSIKEQLSGPELNGVVECPQCGTELKFSLKTGDVRQGDFNQPAPLNWEETIEGHQIAFRLPDSHDQLAMLNQKDPEQASQLLIKRLVQSASYKRQDVLPQDLPEEVLEALGDRINAIDPQVEISFSLHCVACNHRWSALFEINRFVWKEVGDQARSLLADVIQLAQSFGWSEADILSMSPQRREYYLDRI